MTRIITNDGGTAEIAKNHVPVRIYSHIRSGTTCTIAFIAKNLFQDAEYDVTQKRASKTGHWSQRRRARQTRIQMGGKLFADHYAYDRSYLRCPRRPTAYLKGVIGVSKTDPKIYIVRDGRDVACSLWRTHLLINKDWGNYTLSQFLRSPLDFAGSPGRGVKHPSTTIAEHWSDHVNSWAKAPNTLWVRYEDVVRFPADTIQRIARFLGIEPIGELWIPDMPMGIEPHEGTIGTYRKLMTPEDVEFFEQHVRGVASLCLER